MQNKLTPFEIGIGVACMVMLGVGVFERNVLTCGSAGACLCLIISRIFERTQSGKGDFAALDNDRVQPVKRKLDPRQRQAYEAAKENAPQLIRDFLQHGREAILLRTEIIGNLNEQQVDQLVDVVQEDMSLVPAGKVVLKTNELGSDCNNNITTVEPLLIDRFAVTNSQFAEFVTEGGYTEKELWGDDVVDAAVAFVDETGTPGPRFWRDGTFAAGKADNPVVGICWYEARAYARWIGKRLPSNAEWVKTAAWPTAVAADSVRQRNYPWGEKFEPGHSNVRREGIGHTVPVDDFANGDTVNGVRQLSGNVWEWLDGELTFSGSGVDSSTPLALKSLRGGSFDTYLETQASSDFESGDDVMARRHNVGFRCALTMSDLAESAQEKLLAMLEA